MEPSDGIYEPFVGYIVLEQSQAAVDMLGHRLVHVKKVDLKYFGTYCAIKNQIALKKKIMI